MPTYTYQQVPNPGYTPQGIAQHSNQQVPTPQVIVQQTASPKQPQIVQEIQYATMPPKQANQPVNSGHEQLDVPKHQHIPLAKCRVLYLGSAVPLETAQGLEAVQQPLKERYPVDSDGDVPGIDAWLTIFSSGMLMQYVQDKKSAIWFPIQTLHVCAAVKAVTSIDGTTGERVSKFIGLDDQGTENTKHPPMFAAIMRRTKGVKVLECHVFICKSNAAAMALVQSCTHAYEHKEGWTDDSPPNDTIGSRSEARLVPAEPIKESSAAPEFYQKPPTQGYYYTTSKDLVKNYNVFGGGGSKHDTVDVRPSQSDAPSVRDDKLPEQRPPYPLGHHQPPHMHQPTQVQTTLPLPQMHGAITPFGPVMTGMPPPVGVPYGIPTPMPPINGPNPVQQPLIPPPMLPMPPTGYFNDWNMWDPQPVYYPPYDETLYTVGRRERRRTPSPRRKHEKSPRKSKPKSPKPRGRSPYKQFADDFIDDYDKHMHNRLRPRTPEADYEVSPRRRPNSPRAPRDFPYGYDRKGPGSDLILYASRYQRHLPHDDDIYHDNVYNRQSRNVDTSVEDAPRRDKPYSDELYDYRRGRERAGDYGGYSTSFLPKERHYRDGHFDDEDPYNYNREMPHAQDRYFHEYDDDPYGTYNRDRVRDHEPYYRDDDHDYYDEREARSFDQLTHNLGFVP